MKHFILLLILSITGLQAQQVSWEQPKAKKTTQEQTAEYQHAYNHVQIGEASYYADYLAGQPTSSGEAYRLDQLTASHPLLPTGTLLLVKRQDNGASVKVRVNDNTGHGDGSLVVLSRQAAYQLGMLTSGRARVSVQRIGFDNWNPQPSAPSIQMTTKSVLPTAYGNVPVYSQNTVPTTPPSANQVRQNSTTTRPYYRPVNYGNTYSTPDFSDEPVNSPPSNEQIAQDPYAYRTAKSVAATETSRPPAYYGYNANSGNQVSTKEVSPDQYSTTNYTQPVTSPVVAPVDEVQLVSNKVWQGYGVQLAAYGNIENANRQVRSLQNQGIDQIYIATVTKPDGTKINRVMVGPFSTANAAQFEADKLAKENQITGIVISL